MADADEPRIIVDSDWKQEAQAEKQRLAEQERASRGAGARGEFPKPTFNELVQLLASQAVMAMGSRDPQTGQIIVALDLAQIHIELLTILEEKTKGNLTDDEADALSQTLSQLRLLYADTAKAVAQAVKEGKVATTTAGAQPTPDQPPGPTGQSS